MKSKFIFYTLSILLAVSSCSEIIRKTEVPVPPQDSVSRDSLPYRITETFENGTKGSYKTDSVTLLTGSWTLNDALIGGLDADKKEGLYAVRLRTGSISMNFDVAGVRMLYVKHARYGNDAPSEWKLEISRDGGLSYEQVGNTIMETNTSLVLDSFAVQAQGKVRFRISKQGTARVNLDDLTFRGVGSPGIIVGQPDTTDADSSATPEPGAQRGTPSGELPDAPPASGENSNLFLGNPSGAQASILFPENYLIDMKYYTVSYSNGRSTPNWVSWHLDAGNITKKVERRNDFAAFSDLPASWYRVKNTSYSGSGFDRGHNCPSADRVSSAEANSSTFLMVNMVPQAPNNNQKTWNNMEAYLRTLVSSGNEVYVIMGSYGRGGTGSRGTAVALDSNRVTVPSNIWKVAVVIPEGNNDLSRISSTTRVIAVNTPNVNSIDPDWKKYRVSVRDIERATGYNLLSGLPVAVQDAIETTKDSLE